MAALEDHDLTTLLAKLGLEECREKLEEYGERSAHPSDHCLSHHRNPTTPAPVAHTTGPLPLPRALTHALTLTLALALPPPPRRRECH